MDAFNDPEIALSGFYSNLYDLAILDIKMPQMDGFNLCRRLMKIDNRNQNMLRNYDSFKILSHCSTRIVNKR